jgi:hypothetical protein
MRILTFLGETRTGSRKDAKFRKGRKEEVLPDALVICHQTRSSCPGFKPGVI